MSALSLRHGVVLTVVVALAFQTAWGSEPTAEITGRVTNQDGEPLAFANVIVLRTSSGAMTDRDGDFRIEVSPGSYTVKVAYLGHSPEERELNLREGDHLAMLISLHEREYSECEVVVTACGLRIGPSSEKKELVTRTPEISSMLPPYPNPVSGPLSLRFSVAERSRTQIRVFDVQGRLVSEVLDEVLEPGNHARTWQGGNEAGRPAANGVYFVSFASGESVQTMRVVVIR